MEIKISREEFYKSVSKVQSIIERKSNMPILATVLLTANASKVYVTATDLEIGFQQILAAEVIEEGSVAISGRKLFEILKESKASIFHIKEKEDSWVYLSDNVARFNLACLQADEYPAFIEPEGVSMVEVDGEVICEMINKTIYSVTREDAGFKLSGVFTQKVENEGQPFLRMVATDGHRLSLIDKPMPGIDLLKLDEGILIPKKGMLEINRIASEGGKIKIGFKDKNCVVRKENVVIVIRLLDTRFPDYKGVIPERTDFSLEVDRIVVIEAMRKMLILTSERYRAVKIIFENDFMEVNSTNPDLGEANEKIAIAYQGNRFEAGFNPQFIIDTLQSMESEKIAIGFLDESKPCILTGELDNGFLGLLMPMRI